MKRCAPSHHFFAMARLAAEGSSSPEVPIAVASEPALSTDQLRRLVQLFELHGGRVPGRELTAEDFNILQLIAGGFIFRTSNHLDAGCYLVGAALVDAVKQFGRDSR